ncbi:hypothetical protein R3P38DRAFT_3593118 [Favolaschia claudopus]|uniref:Uncharacterized protein n=1 Tax=Favolaschia claudopus TaxID=2862362 RepID=A0AAW0AG43_9AGAR
MTTTTTTRSYTLATPTSGSLSLSPGPSPPSSRVTSPAVTPSASTSTTTTAATTKATARVRFDAECILIPDLSSTGTRRPRMVTKSYSLPLWKKTTTSSGREEVAEEGASAHVMLKVALPRFTTKKSSRDRTPSRSPPAIAPTLPSCLRTPPIHPGSVSTTTPDASSTSFSILGPSLASTSRIPQSEVTPLPDATPLSPPLPPLSAVHITSPSPTPTTITVPLRPCCLECALNAKMEVLEESFSRGALRVRRRAGGPGRIGDTLFDAARRAGLLDAPPTPSIITDLGVIDDESDGGSGLISGTGLAEVNRLVAELELKRLSRSATPTPPKSPTYGGTPVRAPSPSLLGPALARIAEGGSKSSSRAGSIHGDELLVPGSVAETGRASPLLSLGIAVDEVDKEVRRRKSAELDLGVGLRLVRGGGIIDLDASEEDEDRPPASAPPVAAPFAFPPSPTLAPPASAKAKRRSVNLPVRGYADDDDADLFPLPSALGSGSRGGTPTPRSTPSASPRGSPAASASDVSVHLLSAGVHGSGGNLKRLSRGSPVLPSAMRERESSAESGDAMRAPSPTMRTPSQTVCVTLGAVGRKEREARELAALKERESAAKDKERERKLSGNVTGGVAMAKCSRGLLLPPGDDRDCSESSSSREGSIDRRSSADMSTSEGVEEKKLPDLPGAVTPRPYSPGLSASSSSARPGIHLRIASAPAEVSSSSSTSRSQSHHHSTSSSLVPAVSAPTLPSTAPTHPKSASSSAVGSPRGKSASSSPAVPPLARNSSLKRLRSSSAASSTKSGGRKAFGALVDVLKGVTSMSGGTGTGSVVLIDDVVRAADMIFAGHSVAVADHLPFLPGGEGSQITDTMTTAYLPLHGPPIPTMYSPCPFDFDFLFSEPPTLLSIHIFCDTRIDTIYA